MLDLGQDTSGLEHGDRSCGLRNRERNGARRARDGCGGRVARAESVSPKARRSTNQAIGVGTTTTGLLAPSCVRRGLLG